MDTIKVYHGTDKETARIVIQTNCLKGDFPSFGVGFCTTIERAKNFAGIKCQKYLKKGRTFARKQIAILEFEISENEFQSASAENVKDAFTLNTITGKPLKELHRQFRIVSI